jgi:hypothetical protein
MRKTMTAFVAVGVLALGACGDDDNADDDTNTDETDDDNSTDTTLKATGPAADTPFCQDVVGLFDGTETSAAIDAARTIEPPAELAQDWETWINGIEELEASGEPPDTSDPAAAAELEATFRSAEKVIGYIGTECGAPGFTPPSSDTTIGADS